MTQRNMRTYLRHENLSAQVARVAIGLALTLLMIAPLGSYHSLTVSVSGSIWGYMVPAGYVGFITGVMILLFDKLGLRRFVALEKLIIMTGVVVIVTHIVQSAFLESFLSFWTGVPGDYDIDSYSALLSYPPAIGLTAVILGSAMNGSDGTELDTKKQPVDSQTGFVEFILSPSTGTVFPLDFRRS